MGQNKLISRNEMSAKQLVISKNATIDHRVDPNTGKDFFTCGDITGYISPNAVKALNEGQDIDAFRFAEVSKDNGISWIPCLMVAGNQTPAHSTMSKRVSMLLKQLNIGLDTLNRELSYMGQPIIDNVNAKLSDLDYTFLVDYFQSQEMNALNKAVEEMNKCRRKLDDFFLQEFKPIDKMSEIEKSLYFKWIIRYGGKYISFQHSFPNASSLVFSETVFEQLYKWYEMWMTKSEEEKQKEEKKARDERWNNITWTATPLKSGTSIDEETAIMSALKNGNGDAFGFD